MFKKLKFFFLSGIFIFLVNYSQAQEINCTVSINYQKVQSTDIAVFQSLENGIKEFVNYKRWTGDAYKVEERIDCKFLIILESRVDNSFTGSIQVTSSRPVFGTNYKTAMFNINDNNLAFSYTDQQPLNFSLGEFQSELTSVIAFYVYVVLGVDYDSFSPEGGKDYLLKAFDIVTLAQTASASAGWSTTESNSRYALIENLTNSVFAPFTSCLYKYHRLGLDLMKDKKEEATKNIVDALFALEQVHKVRPSSYLFQVFFIAKYSEIVSMFSNASIEDKTKISALMIKLDPGNTKFYNKILEGK